MSSPPVSSPLVPLVVRDVPGDGVLAAYAEAAAGLLGLAVAPEWRDAVLFHLKAIIAASELVQAYPLDDALEGAPVFRA